MQPLVDIKAHHPTARRRCHGGAPRIVQQEFIGADLDGERWQRRGDRIQR